MGISDIKIVNKGVPHETMTKILNTVDHCVNIRDEEPMLNISSKHLGSGCNGSVFEVDGFAVKLFHTMWCADGENLELINGCQHVPKLYAYNKNFMIVEKINGVTGTIFKSLVRHRLANVPEISLENQMSEAIKDIFKRGLIIDDMGYDNFMVTNEGKVILTDLGAYYKVSDWDSLQLSEENILTEVHEAKYAIKVCKKIDSDIEKYYNEIAV